MATKKLIDPKQTKWREQWLTECAVELLPLIEDVSGKKTPKFRISCSFPTRNALSTSRRIVGQCFGGMASADGSHELFISPLLADSTNVAGTVAHELVHANIGNEHGHRKPFIRVGRGVGLIGKPTSMGAGGDVFQKAIDPIIKKLGPYPHVEMKPSMKHKPQGTRLIKVGCAGECEYVVRMTKKWIDIALPACPICDDVMSVLD
jgi:hypothetical protein